jgi:NADPH-dependent curcumin reductase CurA
MLVEPYMRGRMNATRSYAPLYEVARVQYESRSPCRVPRVLNGMGIRKRHLAQAE